MSGWAATSALWGIGVKANGMDTHRRIAAMKEESSYDTIRPRIDFISINTDASLHPGCAQ